MKRLFAVLAVLVPLLALSSCKKDDASAPSIVGTWEMTKVSMSILLEDEEIDADVTERLQAEISFVFNADGTGTITSVDKTTGQSEQDGFEWSLEGNTLTVIESGESVACTLETLTGSQLVFSFQIPDDFITGKMTCTFVRV